MEGSDGSPPSSLWMIRAAELFPKAQMEKEDDQLTVPFQELAGESVRYLGRTDDGILALSNYRVFLLKNSTCSETSIPLELIETAQTRDLFQLVLSCKDASTVKCSFETAEQCSEWARRITMYIGVPESLESLFAFAFYSWTSDYMATSSANAENNEWSGRLQRAGRYEDDFRREVERLQFDLNGTWRITNANADFKLCPSYPELLLVPCCISDETLQNVASFRGSRRLPAVVWRHKQSGAVIARSSQPEVGWLGWRCSKDEQLLKALADACAFDRGEQIRRQNLSQSGESTPSSAEGSHEEVTMDEVRKILIVDARSYTSAVTNRARGGGCECIEYYPCAEIEFMSLGNIHVIRKSFHALRQLCASPPDVQNWLGLLERTMWLQHLSGLLAAAMTVTVAIEKKGRPVLVHCSDGWDRTPQIVATAQLCLDPFYRTVEGFRILVEREWLSYGHKFADRCGHGPGSDELNERCPVFLQWLDVVHQIHSQFPCSFEFSMAYLIKLAQHSHSCLFGTFLCNTVKERIANSVMERTFSVWPFLSGPMYRNPLYVPNRERVLWPAHNVRDLRLWSEVYLGSLGNQNPSDYPPNNVETTPETAAQMTKTRSYGDLLTAGGALNGLTRRSSDPNMTAETHLMINMSDNNSVSSEHNASPVLLKTIIQATTEKLQNLTNELNQSDDDAEIFKINNLDNHSSTNGANGDILSKILEATDNIQIKNLQEQLPESNEIITISRDCDINNGLNAKNSLSSDASRCELTKVKTGERDEIDVLQQDEGQQHVNGIIHNGNNVTRQNSNSDKASSDEIDSGIMNRESSCDSDDMMQSVDLQGDQFTNNILTQSAESDNPWHGSVETSTDTLVPNESHPDNINNTTELQLSKTIANDQLNGNSHPHDYTIDNNTNNCNQRVDEFSQQQNNFFTAKNTSTNNTNPIEPEVHSKPNTTTMDSVLISYSSKNNLNNVISSPSNIMDESILILPEHEKLEISTSGKCSDGNVISSNGSVNSGNNISTTATSSQQQQQLVQQQQQQMFLLQNHRRRRTSSSNSRNEFINYTKNTYGSATNSRFSTPGIRSLPLTPPGAPDRPVVISCPDGLAHALSEQNIRLQQLVYEHKVREEALQKELHSMRVALLKKICPQCNNQNTANDEQCSVLDNIESSSICSWEAVEDRSGPSSGANSAQPTNSVLWVPDHAVSRCTGCDIEFWIGRRRHHCRSCGQIFCADCSEFWAPLPDERLYTPVRLCGPCYHAVTTRIQQQQQQARTAAMSSAHSQYQKSTSISSSSSSTSTLPATAAQFSVGLNNTIQQPSPSIPPQSSNSYCVAAPSTSMEACKHAASPPRNDRGNFKATAASN